MIHHLLVGLKIWTPLKSFTTISIVTILMGDDHLFWRCIVVDDYEGYERGWMRVGGEGIMRYRRK